MTPDKPLPILIGVVGMIAALLLPRRYALLALAVPISIHPSTLLFPPDNLSMTAQRLVAIVLILRCILTPSIRANFKPKWVDAAMLGYFAAMPASQLMAMPVGIAINNRAGFFLQAMVPFW